MDSNVFNTGSGKETGYLPPFLHTLKATETTNLDRIQWGDKLEETKDFLVKIEQTMASGFERLNMVCHPKTPELRSHRRSHKLIHCPRMHTGEQNMYCISFGAVRGILSGVSSQYFCITTRSTGRSSGWISVMACLGGTISWVCTLAALGISMMTQLLRVQIQEVARIQQVQDRQAAQIHSLSASGEGEANIREESTDVPRTRKPRSTRSGSWAPLTQPPEKKCERHEESSVHQEEQTTPAQMDYEQPDEEGLDQPLILRKPPLPRSSFSEFASHKKIRRTEL